MMTRTIDAAEISEAVAAITGLAAKTVCESHPHLDRHEVLAAFTTPPVAGQLARRYTASLQSGDAPWQAAQDGGTWLLEHLTPYCLQAHEEALRPCLWLATRDGEVGYDELFRVVVRARSEGEAVAMAECFAASREGAPGARFTAERLPQEGEAGVVMEDFIRG